MFIAYYLSVVNIEIALKIRNKGFVKYKSRVKLYHIGILIYYSLTCILPGIIVFIYDKINDSSMTFETIHV